MQPDVKLLMQLKKEHLQHKMKMLGCSYKGKTKIVMAEEIAAIERKRFSKAWKTISACVAHR